MTTDLVFGLATWKALVAVFEPSREDLAVENRYDRALATARVEFLDSARVTPWKAYVPMPHNPQARALLAEDLRAWGELPGLIDEFEGDRPNDQIRLAFVNAALKLDPTDTARWKR